MSSKPCLKFSDEGTVLLSDKKLFADMIKINMTAAWTTCAAFPQGQHLPPCSDLMADMERCTACLDRIDDVDICKLCASGPELSYKQKVFISIGVLLGVTVITIIAIFSTRMKKRY